MVDKCDRDKHSSADDGRTGYCASDSCRRVLGWIMNL